MKINGCSPDLLKPKVTSVSVQNYSESRIIWGGGEGRAGRSTQRMGIEGQKDFGSCAFFLFVQAYRAAKEA